MKLFIAAIAASLALPASSEGLENRTWLILANVEGGIEKIEKATMKSCKAEIKRMKSELRLLGGTSFCVSGK